MKYISTTKTCAQMCMAALFVIAKDWKCLKCPTTGRWINKIWYKCWGAIKKWIHATTEIHLKNTILCERTRHKTAYYMIPLIWNTQKRQSYRVRRWVRGCQELGGRKSGEWVWINIRDLIGWRKVLKLDMVIVAQLDKCIKIT